MGHGRGKLDISGVLQLASGQFNRFHRDSLMLRSRLGSRLEDGLVIFLSLEQFPRIFRRRRAGQGDALPFSRRQQRPESRLEKQACVEDGVARRRTNDGIAGELPINTRGAASAGDLLAFPEGMLNSSTQGRTPSLFGRFELGDKQCAKVGVEMQDRKARRPLRASAAVPTAAKFPLPRCKSEFRLTKVQPSGANKPIAFSPPRANVEPPSRDEIRRRGRGSCKKVSTEPPRRSAQAAN